MGILFVDRNNCELAMSGKSLCLRVNGEVPRHIPAALLERVVLHPGTRLSAGVLAALTDCGVGVLVIGGRRGERIASVVGTPHKDVQRRITQVQRLSDPDFCLAWCRYLVQRKINAQLRLVNKAMEVRPDKRKPLFDAKASMEKCVASLADHHGVDTMRGVEGAAAAAYFRGFASLFPASLAFFSRQRRPPTDPVNACLSLGYTLLHSLAVQICHSQGLDPMVGYLHAPAHGRASLASDLIEPWRARVDELVWNLFRSRTLTSDHFGSDGNTACLLNKAGRSHYYAAWAAQAGPLRQAMRRQANLVARSLDELASRLGDGRS